MTEERRPRTKHVNHVSVRLDAPTMLRVEALAPVFSTEWRTATRSDVLRGLILDALERYERLEDGARPAHATKPRGAAKKGKRGAKVKRG